MLQSLPGIFLFRLIYSVYSKQQNYGSCPSGEFGKGQQQEQEPRKSGPHYWGDADLNVSGSLRDDKRFPFAINIPLPQTIAKTASRPQRRPQPGCYLPLLLTLLRDAARGDARFSAEEEERLLLRWEASSPVRRRKV